MKKTRLGITAFFCGLGILFAGSFSSHAAQAKEFANVVVFAYFEQGNTADYNNISNEYGDVRYYKGLKDYEFYQDAKVTKDFMDMYDGKEEYSVTNYLKKVSNGNFMIKNVFPQYDGTKITPYRIKNIKLSQVLSGNEDDMIIQEIMKNVDLPSDKVVDYNKDGCIDNLTVILRGGGKGVGSTNGRGVPSLYAHKGDFGGTDRWKNSNVKVSNFNMLNTYTIMESLVASESGVLIHEFMHTLGYPDLYTIDGEEDPVYSWDIMASSSRYPSYPLTYLRMENGEWLTQNDFYTIDETTKSITLTEQNQTGGKKGCIIRSPLNNEEFFVVEFRKKPASYGIDYYTGGSGIIVYRINPTVENLSNHGGQIGVYVFRPQSGEFYNAQNSKMTVLNAFLSKESRRTSMGTNDMGKKLRDGAIAFSSGENSGIVISNVSSSAGNQITFDVTLPTKADYDIWNDTKFADQPDQSDYSKNMVVQSWNKTLYMAAYRKQKISLWKYVSGAWSQVGTEIPCSSLSSLQMEVYKDELYLAYDEERTNIILKKMKKGSANWTDVAKTAGYESSLKAMKEGLYMAYCKEGAGGKVTAVLAKAETGSIKTLSEYETGFLGQADLAEMQGTIYVSVRNGSGKISVYEYKNGTMTKRSKDNLSANSYDLESTDSKLYVTLGGSQSELTLHTYDGKQWSSLPAGRQCFQPQMSVSQGNLYLLLIPNQQGSLQVIRYDESQKKFVEEGIAIDGTPSVIDFTSIDNKLYAAYVRQSDRKIYVKEKETAKTGTTVNPGGSGTAETGAAVKPGGSGTAETGAAVKPGGSGTAETGAAVKPGGSGTAETGAAVKPGGSGTAETGAAVKPGGSGTAESETAEFEIENNTVIDVPEVDTERGSDLTEGNGNIPIGNDFVMNPKDTKIKKLKRGKESFIVYWKAQKDVSGYQIQYAANRKFKKAKTYTINQEKVSRKKISKLKSGKTYYVRVKTFKKTEGGYFESLWSKIKKVKVRG